VLVKLEAKDDQYSFNSNDVHISDLRQALQLSGAGVAT
jgi:hypothetical protein